MKTMNFQGLGGSNIFTRVWRPEAQRPKAIVAIAHGVLSHSGYYEWVGEQLMAAGFAVYAIDHRGRGRSDGERFFVEKIEDYVADLPVRLALYRRLAEIEDDRAIEAFGAELVDRFGPLPQEVEHLLQVVAIKSLCRQANVERIETGPKGAVVSFRDNSFADPDRLVAFIRDQGAAARVRPDMKVVLFADWERPEQRLRGAAAILRRLVALAQPAAAA